MMVWVLLLCILLAVPVSAGAAGVTLAWDYVQGADPAVLFAIYKQVGCAESPTRATVDVSMQTWMDPGPFFVGEMVCYTVTAVDSVGLESSPSNVLAVRCKRASKRQVVCGGM